MEGLGGATVTVESPDDEKPETNEERARREMIETARKVGAVIDEKGLPWRQPPEPDKPAT
jgi:hypothetical protein